MFDADAVAIEAARHNVPAARRTILSPAWPAARPGRRPPPRYDWIVSNPPVHRGQPDCFDVVLALIRGARERLRPNGVLWIVAQEQVPVGRMMSKHGGFGWVRATPSDDGRFFTWSAGGRRGEGSAGDGEGGAALPASDGQITAGGGVSGPDAKKKKKKKRPREHATGDAGAAAGGEKRGGKKRRGEEKR
jgi:16S rRNA (guanine1207-N2)-methyltransferase